MKMFLFLASILQIYWKRTVNESGPNKVNVQLQFQMWLFIWSPTIPTYYRNLTMIYPPKLSKLIFKKINHLITDSELVEFKWCFLLFANENWCCYCHNTYFRDTNVGSTKKTGWFTFTSFNAVNFDTSIKKIRFASIPTSECLVEKYAVNIVYYILYTQHTEFVLVWIQQHKCEECVHCFI